MKFTRFYLHHVKSHLSEYGNRESLLLRLEDDQGRCGLGEIAPLPGRSVETLAEVKKIVQGNFFSSSLPSALPPSVAFGLSSALDDLTSSVHPFSFARTHLSFEGEKARSGIADVKIKASSSLDESERRTRSWLQAGAKVRVDVHGQWTEEECIDFCNRFTPCELEYIEDPGPLRSLSYFVQKTTIPIAIDYAASRVPLESFIDEPRITHVIIKPSLFGGEEVCRQLVHKIYARNKQVVFSSLYETVVGLSHIVRLGKRLGITAPFGVDTLKLFPMISTKQELAFQQGEIIPDHDVLPYSTTVQSI